MPIFFQNSPFFQNYDINLERDGLLGDGSFSICRKCVEKSTGNQYAVKIVSRKIDCTQEINLLRACQGHPNIVNLHNVYYDEVFLFYSIISKYKLTWYVWSAVLTGLVRLTSSHINKTLIFKMLY